MEVSEVRKRHKDVRAAISDADVPQPGETQPQEVRHGEDQVKLTVTAIAVLSAVLVASAAYTAWLNILEERQTKKAQPLLGVVYQKQRR